MGDAAFLEIPKDQLKISAAEANLRHCARGSSVLALRHGGYIMSLLTDEQTPDREPPCPIALRAATNGAGSPCEANLALRPCDIEMQKLCEMKAYAQRLEPVVAHNASQKF